MQTRCKWTIQDDAADLLWAGALLQKGVQKCKATWLAMCQSVVGKGRAVVSAECPIVTLIGSRQGLCEGNGSVPDLAPWLF